MLRGIFGLKRDEVTEEWRKLHNEELNNLYCSQNIIRVIKSIRMKWAWNVARMEERRGACGILLRNPRERDHLEEPGIDGSIKVRWIFRK